MRGKFIVIEGPDGVGKSDVCAALPEALPSHRVISTIEPGGTALGSRLREITNGWPSQPSSSIPWVHSDAKCLLYLADRMQHLVEVVEPALRTGTWVVSDRFELSTLVYQGLFVSNQLSGHLHELCAWARGQTTPDACIVIDRNAPFIEETDVWKAVPYATLRARYQMLLPTLGYPVAMVRLDHPPLEGVGPQGVTQYIAQEVLPRLLTEN